MRQGRPHLLAVDDPFARGGVLTRFGAHVRQIGTRTGLGIALTPQLGTVLDTRQKSLLLGFRSHGDERRANQPFADMADPTGATGAGIFFVINELLGEAQAAPAMFLRPAHASPAGGGELLFPLPAQFGEGIFIARATAILERGVFTDQVALQPGGDVAAEGFVGSRKFDLHGISFSGSGSVEQRGGDALAQNLAAAQPVGAGLGALEVELGVIFPGEADATV